MQFFSFFRVRLVYSMHSRKKTWRLWKCIRNIEWEISGQGGNIFDQLGKKKKKKNNNNKSDDDWNLLRHSSYFAILCQTVTEELALGEDQGMNMRMR